MKVENRKNNYVKNNPKTPSFKGPLDGAITHALVAVDTNPMVNAALVDVFSMVIPRTYVDTKKRNKYAGAETLFREITGTFIVCLSSGIWAKGISHLYNKYVNPEVKINPNSWASNNSLKYLQNSWNNGKNSKKYISNILSNLSGTDGNNTVKWKNINWKNVEWIDDSKWEKLTWQNPKFKNIQNKIKSEKEIFNTFGQILDDKKVDEKDAKQVLDIIEQRIVNAFKVTSVSTKIDKDSTLSTSVKNLLRDAHDLGKNVFTNKKISTEKAIDKLTKLNTRKTLGALAIASTLGLTNQYINRKITKKRTGTDAFVGEVDYKNLVSSKNKNHRENKVKLFGLKLLASAGIIGLAAAVMKINLKDPKNFFKKLEFTSAITSGNAIKTVYTATLVGRFLAAKNETELRESATRDYLGFLNWLVFGGFVAKGVANLLDKNRTELFNINEKGKGLKHWLNNISLKSHAEIAAKGGKDINKKILKLNLAHASGLLYSTIALGVLLPLLNITVTKSKHKASSGQKLKDKASPLPEKPINTSNQTKEKLVNKEELSLYKDNN